MARLGPLVEKWVVIPPEDEPPLGCRRLTADLAGEFSTDHWPEKIEAVIHLAQSPRFREGAKEAAHIFGVNTQATVKLLEYGRRAGAERFILASSGSVYESGTEPLTEESPLAANPDVYSASKLAAELAVRSFGTELETTICRFFQVYGPGQHESMLIPRLAGSIREGRPITLPGGEGIRLSPTHVSDAAGAILAALKMEGSTLVNVAGPEVVSLKSMVRTMGRVLGREPILQETEGQPPVMGADPVLMRDLLEAPRLGFEEGFGMTVEEAGW